MLQYRQYCISYEHEQYTPLITSDDVNLLLQNWTSLVTAIYAYYNDRQVLKQYLKIGHDRFLPTSYSLCINVFVSYAVIK
jgi:hypothetical protein